MTGAVAPHHLFICGCPRSGTTLAAEILNAHPRVAVGIERYGNRFFDQPLTPDLFVSERFYDLQPGDTFYSSFDFSPIYERKRLAYADMLYVGDKIPMLYDRLDMIRDGFSKPKVVFCVRNILDVASSFQTRLDNPEDTSWSDELDGPSAVELWNASLASYIRHREDIDMFVFHQDRFMDEGEQQFEQMLVWLGLDPDPKFTATLQHRMIVSERLLVRRKFRLTEATKRKIAEEADFRAYRRTIRRAQRQVAGQAGSMNSRKPVK
jgi:hypothetical protein